MGWSYVSREFPECLSDLATQGMVMDVTHVPGDSYTSAFNAGKQALALHIFEILGTKPEEFDELRRMYDGGRPAGTGGNSGGGDDFPGY